MIGLTARELTAAASSSDCAVSAMSSVAEPRPAYRDI